MSDKTTIEWTDATWNPFRATLGRWACTRVSPGCDHCYAATMNRRFGGPDYARPGQPPNDTLRLDERALPAPLHWRKPRRIFVHSMTDTFHEAVPDAWLDRLFAVMALTPWHTYQVLTKRPKRMRDYVLRGPWAVAIAEIEWPADLVGQINAHAAESDDPEWYRLNGEFGARWPLPNVWLGTSIELDRYTWRANLLRETPAAVRFISAEPLLGPLPSLDLAGIDWLIVGAESGHGARPMNDAWVRDLRDRCVAAGAAFFFKQRAVNGRKTGLPELDGRVWAEFPEGRELAHAAG